MEATGHETSYLSVARSFSKADQQSRGVGIETVGVAFATKSRFCIGEDVPVLRFNHAPGETVMSGVREVACSSSFDKIAGMRLRKVRFLRTLNNSGDQICFGLFLWCF